MNPITTPETDTERCGLPSASTFHVLVNCPGQRQLAELYPDKTQEPSSPEAERGARIHKARETQDTSALQDETEVTAYNRWLGWESVCANRWARDMGFELDSVRQQNLEERLWLHDPQTMQPVLSARIDVHYVTKHPYVLIVDGKTGSAIHAGLAKDSWQLRIAAVACKYEYDAKHVRVALVKPEAGNAGTWDYCDYDAEALNLWEYSIQYHLWFSKQAQAPRRAGEWCRYCPCRGFCPEACTMAMIPSAGVTKEGLIQTVQQMQPHDMAAVWVKKSLVDAVFQAVKDHLATMKDDELAAVGLKRRAGRRLDSITKIGPALALLREQGLTDDEINACISLSIPSVASILATTKNLKDKESRQWVDQNLAECITKATAEPSIVGA